jgi:hypothetical protein
MTMKINLEFAYDDLIEALAPSDVDTAECLYCNQELGVCQCIPGEANILAAPEELYSLVNN